MVTIYTRLFENRFDMAKWQKKEKIMMDLYKNRDKSLNTPGFNMMVKKRRAKAKFDAKNRKKNQRRGKK